MWKNVGNGQWSVPSNWDPSGPPIAESVATFNFGGVVSVPDNTVIDAFLIGNTTVTFDLGGLSNEMIANNDFLLFGISIIPSAIGTNDKEHGELIVQNGTFDFDVVSIAAGPGAVGGLTVRPNTSWKSESTFVGDLTDTMGSLTIDGGSAVVGSLGIGHQGAGTLVVRGGGALTTGSIDSAALGIEPGSSGTATITGLNSRWDTTTLIVGNLGMGTVNVESAGTLNAEGLSIADNAGGQGHVSVHGAGSVANVTVPGDAIVLVGAQGVISSSDGGTINIGTGTGTTGAINLMNDGAISGAGTVEGTVKNLNGTVYPGPSTGELTISGSYEQSASGTLRIDIAGNAAGQLGVLDVDGTAQLAGTLDVRLSGGFQPNPGDEFTILTAMELLNNGVALTAAAAQLFTLNVDVANDEVVLTARGAPLPGDYNGNGIVDAADYTTWRDTLGSTTDLTANGDDAGASQGRVDQADYIYWKSRFGSTSGAAAAVPEPSAAALVALLTFLGLWACYVRTKFKAN
jgi:T5SS/PEP-CTERM-associated repeat protein